KGVTVRVLVIEDDEEMARAVASGLRRARMAVDVAFDGTAGLERALLNDYDVVVLDRDLPGLHGDEVCAELVAAGCRSRVLMLTAAAAMEDLVGGLGIGADDYLPKPFDFPVLVARIGALMRRAAPPPPPRPPPRGPVVAPPAPRAAPPGNGEPSAGTGGSSSRRRSSAYWNCCSPPRAGSSRPRSFSSGFGTRPPTRSRTPSRSLSAGSGPSSETPRSSRPSPSPATG